MGGVPSVVVAIAGSQTGDFILRLYREGAWLVLDPIVLGGCQPARTVEFPR